MARHYSPRAFIAFPHRHEAFDEASYYHYQERNDIGRVRVAPERLRT